MQEEALVQRDSRGFHLKCDKSVVHHEQDILSPLSVMSIILKLTYLTCQHCYETKIKRRASLLPPRCLSTNRCILYFSLLLQKYLRNVSVGFFHGKLEGKALGFYPGKASLFKWTAEVGF